MATGGFDKVKGNVIVSATPGKLADLINKKMPKPEMFSTPAPSLSPHLGPSTQKPMFLSSRPPTFLGKQGDDFELWVKRFEAWCKLHAPSNEDKVLYFPTMLGDAAFSVYSSLTE